MSGLLTYLETVRRAHSVGVCGRVRSVSGLTISASGLPAPVGAMCAIERTSGPPVDAQVVGFRDDVTLLMPLGDPQGVAVGQVVRLVRTGQHVPVGPDLLGRVIDARGEPLDGGPSLLGAATAPLHAPPPAALERSAIDRPLSVGIRSINSLLTIGIGQRMGIFAGTGVGKSVLLGMMARYASADVNVIALVGERGREVRAFIENDLGPDGLKRSVVVVSTSDQSPVLRVRAVFAATAVAEYFRDRGQDVLLMVDSLTRMAMAQRQIGLSAGEPPATKGYPPSAFSLMPQVLERAGRTPTGSITGLYTVLVEGDDLTEPVADAARGILDGHVWLSRRLASRGQYPAVDVLESISRVMPEIVSKAHLEAALKVRRQLAVWRDIEDLVNIGAYTAGTSPEYDLAIQMRPRIEAFLRQAIEEESGCEQAGEALLTLAGEIDRAALPAAAAADSKDKTSIGRTALRRPASKESGRA